MNIRKIMIGIMALTLMTSTMTACSNKDSSSDSSSSTTTTSSSEVDSTGINDSRNPLTEMKMTIDDNEFTLFESTAEDFEKVYSFTESNVSLKHKESATMYVDLDKADFNKDLDFRVTLTNFGEDNADYKTYTITSIIVNTDRTRGDNKYPIVKLPRDIMWGSKYSDINNAYGEPLATNIINDSMTNFGYEFDLDKEINGEKITGFYSVTLSSHTTAGVMNIALETAFQ